MKKIVIFLLMVAAVSGCNTSSSPAVRANSATDENHIAHCSRTPITHEYYECLQEHRKQHSQMTSEGEK